MTPQNCSSGNFFKSLCATGFLTLTAQTWAAPIPYGDAIHQNPTWQQLQGSSDNVGITWSTDGINWGRDDVFSGDDIVFRLDIHKNKLGSHYADFAKLWVDWGRDGWFDAADAALFGKKIVHNNPVTAGSYNITPDPQNADFSFYSASFTLDDSDIGEYWLRGRTVCSESLLKAGMGSQPWAEQWNHSDADYNSWFQPTGTYYQGESATLSFFVNPAKVPTPSALALIALGVAGLSLRRRS